MNQVILIGNAGNDAEYKRTQRDVPVTLFTMATTTRWKDRNGQPQQATEWHYCRAWRDMADKCAEIRKGDRIFVVGEIKAENFDTKCSSCNAPIKKKYTYIDVRNFSISIKIENQQSGNNNNADGKLPY